MLGASVLRGQEGADDAASIDASGAAWYRAGEPIPMGDGLYYPSGPIIFFDPKIMTMAGFYRGVPLYADTTREPYSFVLVPIGGREMRPYERRRSGELAGTTGSTVPSMPVAAIGAGSAHQEAAGPPTRSGESAYGEASGVSPERRELTVVPPSRSAGGPAATSRTPDYVPGHVSVTTRRAESNDGIWIMFAGLKWIAHGPAVPLDSALFVSIGTHSGFPVFAREGDRPPRVIFLPSRAGLVAPYERK